jgi:hypothetical protein
MFRYDNGLCALLVPMPVSRWSSGFVGFQFNGMPISCNCSGRSICDGCPMLVAALKPIYTAVKAEATRDALDAFADGPWRRKYPAIAPPWAPPAAAGDPVLCLSQLGGGFVIREATTATHRGA